MLGSSLTGLPRTRTSVLAATLPDFAVTVTVPGLSGAVKTALPPDQVTSPAGTGVS